MTKKLLFGMFAAAGMLMATSCQNDELDAVQTGNESVVSFTLEQPGISTRSYSDGLTATTLTYAVYDATTEEFVTKSEDEITFVNKTAIVNLRLVTGKTYNILFWADAEEAPYTFDETTKTITVDYTNIASQEENRDAFFALEKELLVDGAISKEITLYRPFAQLNIGTTDAEEDAVKTYAPTQSSVTVKNVYNTLNLFSGEVTGESELTYAMANIPGEDETFPVANVKYLSMNYLLVSKDKELVDVEFTISNGSHNITREYASVPVQRNYRTNIYGKLLTDPADFTINIEEEYEKPDYEYLVTGSVNLGLSAVWADINLGATAENPVGTYMTHTEALNSLPDGWRLPTAKEAKELVNNCTWEKKTAEESGYGVAGYLVTGAGGNTLFFPVTGTVNGNEYILYWVSDTTDGPYGDFGLAITDLGGSVEVAGYFTSPDKKTAVRLVQEGIKGVDLGTGVLWAPTVYGATEDNPRGTYMTVAEAANVEGYRLPTAAEYEELINGCDWEKTEQNGVEGYLFTSKTNGNSIFFPLIKDCSESAVNEHLYYPSSTIDYYTVVMNTMDGHDYGPRTGCYFDITNTKLPVYLVVE